MKVSVILLDWSVRESFHAIDYLNKQVGVDRNRYELIWVEYFDRKVVELVAAKKQGKLDKYVVLGNPPGFYRKHVGWNEGALASEGDVVVLCDSDAMFPDNFILEIIKFFQENSDSFLHIDEIRNDNRKLWPFSYPEWNKVLCLHGLTNWDYEEKVTLGLSSKTSRLSYEEQLFEKNYGSCLCVSKNVYFKYGGLDEHNTYTGLFCGVYDLTFRLINAGLVECWHRSLFLMHTYHPWAKPNTDYLGPHVRHMSTTSLKYYEDGSKMPNIENRGIKKKRLTLYKEPSRHGKFKISIIVPDVKYISEISDGLYDAISRATVARFQIIGLSDNLETQSNGEISIVKCQGDYNACLAVGVSYCEADIIIIIPTTAIFRPKAIDELLCDQYANWRHLVYLNVATTYSNGFLWTHWMPQSKSDNALFIAFDKNHVNKKEIDNLIVNANSRKQIKYPMVWASCQVEHWVRDNRENGECLRVLLDKVLEYEYLLNHEEPTKKEINESNKILRDVIEVFNNEPQKLLAHFMGGNYNIVNVYRFVGGFAKQQTYEFIGNGYLMLIGLCRLLAEEISSNRYMDNYVKRCVEKDAIYFMGVANYKLGIESLRNSNQALAVDYFTDCLECLPGHSNAREYLQLNGVMNCIG